MAGYPYDPATSFVRDPQGYAHDAFGHVGADDLLVRPNDVCFRTIPHTGTDISSKEPRWKNGRDNQAAQMRTPVLAPVSGTIVRASTDPEAGLFHIIKADGRDEWWIGGHHSRFERASGRVDRGDVIARMGASGGAKGVHVHWSVATSLAAALAYIGGWVQYRSGRSVATWSGLAIRGRDQRLYGLIDPWPLIVREWAAAEREADKSNNQAEDNEEAEIMGAIDEIQKMLDKQTELLSSRQRREARPEVYFIETGEDGTVYTIDDSPAAALIHPASGFIMPLDAPEGGKRGQVGSLTRNYRIIAEDSRPQGFHERVFWNTIKDVARGAGVIDRNIGAAEGVAWARSIF